MRDIPLLVVALTVCAYWLRVAAMVVRARRKQHRDVGVIPERPAERAMWLVFVPAVLAWCVGLGVLGDVLAILGYRARHAPEEPPRTRGPASYAGPGSLGGTQSALRR